MTTPWLYSTKWFLKLFSHNDHNLTKSISYSEKLTSSLPPMTDTIIIELQDELFIVDNLVMTETDVILFMKSLGFAKISHESKTDLAFKLMRAIEQVPENEIITMLLFFNKASNEEKLLLSNWLLDMEPYVTNITKN